MNYVHADSARDAIFEAVIYLLGTINGSNPYNYKINTDSIFEEEPQVKNVASWPAVAVYTFPEKVNLGATNTITKRLKIGLHFYTGKLPSGVNARKWRNRMLMDLEYLISNNPGLPGSGGAHTCTLAEVGDNDPVPKLLDETYTSIGVELNVMYNQDLNDPSVQV